MDDAGAPIAYSSEWIAGNGFHVAIAVPDLDAAVEFYCGLLGLEQVWSHAPEQAEAGPAWGPGEAAAVRMLVCPGGSRIALVHDGDVDAAAPGAPRRGGLRHLSLGVEDVLAAHEKLVAAGWTALSEPAEIGAERHPLRGWLWMSLEDPWGTPLELLGPHPARLLDTGERFAATARRKLPLDSRASL